MSTSTPTALDHAEVLFRRTAHCVLGARGEAPRGWHDAVRAVGRLATRARAKAIDAVVFDGVLTLALDTQRQCLPDPGNRYLLALGRIARLRVRCVVGEWVPQPEVLGRDPARESLGAVARWYLARIASLEHDVARDRDVEAVHQLRIALRRLRCVTRVASARGPCPWTDDVVAFVRTVGAAAGRVRDLDVTLELLARVDVAASHRASLGERLRASRTAPQEALAATLEGPAHRARRVALDASLTSLTSPRASTRKAARAHLERELAGLGRALHGDLQCDEGFHEVRKRARRVRDAIDVTAPALKRRERRWRRRLQPLQAHLGSLNDASIMLAAARGDDADVLAVRDALARRRVTLLAELATPLALLAGALDRRDD